MLPVLLDLKFVKIYTFGVFLVLAFFWASFLLWKNIRLTSYKEDDIFDSLFLSLIGAIFFGRLIYVVLNFNKFGFDLLKFLLINGYPGLSLYGCLIGGLLTLLLILPAKKIKFAEAIDYFISPLFLALAFGKLGSFFSGAEVGTKTKFILSIKYFGFDGLRHLTPFYEALVFFLAVYLAQLLLMQIRREKYPRGFNLNVFSWYLALTYFVFDKIKVDHLYFLGQSINYWLSLLILLTFSFYFLYYFRSVVFNKLIEIINYLKKYVNKIIQKIYSHSGKKIAGGKEKDTAPNHRIEKK